MKLLGDPIGQAIFDYSKSQISHPITVESDICEDDYIESAYLFRTYEQLPELEKKALSMVNGRILDIGACAGAHSLYLLNNDHSIISNDISKGAINYLDSLGLTTLYSDVMAISGQKFDTILLLMNGLGLAKSLAQLPDFLLHLKSLLHPGGKILCDSSDIKYLYEDDEGALWIDLNSSYYGEVEFNMKYKDSESGWFKWLYVDQDSLNEICENQGLKCSIIFEGENHHYLAEIK